MELSAAIKRRILLLSMVTLVVPMVVFPSQLGLPLARTSLLNVFWELVYYGIVIYLFHRHVSLVHLFQASGACLVFRFALGAIFGILVAVIYNLDLKVSVTMGMSSYLPVIILHVLAVPFILKPVLARIYSTGREEPVPRRRRGRQAAAAPTTSPDQGLASIAISKDKGIVTQSVADSVPHITEKTQPGSPAESESAPARPFGEANGFERAVRYIGEHGSVDVACVADHEGLLLASFRRGQVVPEDWAPMADLLLENNALVLEKSGLARPQKVDLLLDDKRVIVAREDSIRLIVVAERQSDDLLNIRINQAIEMISKYIAEKYSDVDSGKVEISHVRST
ncbi:MAG: hypothetical protein JSU65_07855 [Candidatus Zixiibacteriota bacterium]|nr:MAG: hypothetical protein JSU65_07855 [candidate division Zixibacteria bacterium]